MSINTFKAILNDPRELFNIATARGLLNWMSDEQFLKLRHRLLLGEKLDLEHPVSLNEKYQYLKLHDRRDEYTEMADKYAVKRLISEKLGEEYVIPLLGVWDRPEDIDFDALPDRFVLKCTHDSGGHVICRDKAALDIPAARSFLSKRLKRNYYWMNREWPYKNIRPRIIAEKFMENPDGSEPLDYKFFFFGGKLECFVCCLGEAEHLHRYCRFDSSLRFFDSSVALSTLDVSRVSLPDNIEEMIAVAEKLARGHRYIRIDLYSIGGHIYFGEYTFYPGGGYSTSFSPSYAAELAEKLDIEGLR